MQPVPRLDHGGGRRLDGDFSDGSHVRPLTLERDLAAGNSRHVEQVVDEAHHDGHLAIHHRQQALVLCVLGASQFHDLQRRSQRCKRVAEFVCQGRKEFILASVGEAQCFVGLAQCRQLISDLILAAPGAQCGLYGAEQHAHGGRTVDDGDVGQALHDGYDAGRAIKITHRTGEHHRQIRPRVLICQCVQHLRERRGAQGRIRDDQCSQRRADHSRERCRVIDGERIDVRPAQPVAAPTAPSRRVAGSTKTRSSPGDVIRRLLRRASAASRSRPACQRGCRGSLSAVRSAERRVRRSRVPE